MRYLIRVCSRWHIAALFWFVGLSLLVRLPFFFEAVIDWDESTFILVGQSLLDGHLPYTELWDLKPPFVAVAFAIFISLLGKSIASVRLAGALCVALTAWFTYITGRTIWTSRAGMIGGTLFVLIISLFPSGQAIMTEHVALLPLMGAAVVAITATKLTLRRLFWIGLWLTVATMVRLNLAYVTLVVGIFVVLMPLDKEGSFSQVLRTIALRGFAYATGSLLVIFATALPYIATSQFSVWWQSIVIASLSYSNSQMSLPAALYEHCQTIITTMAFAGGGLEVTLSSFSLAVVSGLVWVGGIVGVGISIVRWKTFLPMQRKGSLFLSCFFASIVFSLGQGVAELKDGSVGNGDIPELEIVNQQSNGMFEHLHRLGIAQRLAM